MITAEEALRAGDLDAALAALQDKIRNQPADPKLRTFLFQLLAVRGDWDRALNQLKVVAEMEAAALPMAQAYREAILCERFRQAVFEGRQTPLVFGEPEDWIALLIQALGHTARGEHAQADALRAEAFEKAPATGGTLDGQPFAWIADADSRLGPVLEALLNGRYYWIPLHRIRRIDVEPPEDLRDFVWAPAHFEWTNGGELVGLIPTRYPGSEAAEDSAVRLARKTEWTELSDQTFIGLGQRMLATDNGETALLDVRQLVLDGPPEAGSEAAGPGGADA
jgi:type VI secretion system protein ImpE